MADRKNLAHILTFKLELLNGQREKLIQTVEAYFSQVTSMAQAWIETKEESSQEPFQDVSLGVDQALAFLAGKAEDIKQGPRVQGLDFTTSSKVTASSSAPSPLAAQESPSLFSNQQFLKLQERVKNLEKERKTALAYVKSELDKVKEKTNSVHQLRDDLETLKKRADSIPQMEDEIKSLRSKLDELSEQCTLQRSKDNGWMKKFEDNISQAENKNYDLVHDLSELGKTVDRSGIRVEEIDKKLDDIDERLSDLETVKEEITKMTSVEEMSKQREEDHEKMEAMEERVRRIEEEKMENDEKMGNVEERLDQLEDNVETQRLVIIEDRLTKIEEKNEKNLKMLHDVQSDVQTCQSKLEAIEKRHKPVVGFSVCNPFGSSPTLDTNTVVTCFTRIVSNIGNHYDPSTGIFTAPHDGMYMVALNHIHWSGNIRTELHVMHTRTVSGVEETAGICVSWTSLEKTTCTDLGVVCLSAGDELHVLVVCGGKIACPSGFSCFLLG